MRPIHAILPAIVGALVGCRSETDIVSFVPVIAVQPAALDYGEVVSGDATPSLDVLVANLGRADLIADLTLEGEDAAAFSVPEEALHLELPPDGSVVIPVTFAPTDLRPYAGVLAVTNNDVKQAVVPVPLSGIGRVPYAPDIAIEPTDTLDLGTVAVGEDETGFFQVRNLGDADLVLGTITQSGAGAFHLDQDYSGVVIAPGQARPVVLTYTPFQAGGDSGAVHIPSNDPDEPLVDVTLLANGGGTFAYPEAVIDCPGQVDLAGPIDVPLDGSASTDPGGQALTWDWSIARRPSAADQAATPDPTDTPATTVRLDAAGTWEVQLVVTNEDGVPSVPTKCVIDAVPLDDLHVELSWGGPTSDLDLHLADGTSGLFEVPGDTSFCNPNPDWGTAGQSADDPRLDLDDDEGFGPENINVPAPAKGAYAVRVHLFDDVDDGAVTARVTVFTYGTAVWSGSQVMRRNEVWEVGQVNWPDGTFGVGSEPLWNAGGDPLVRVIALTPLLLVACNGPENTFRELVPSISVFPEIVAFGEVGPPREETLDLLLSNVGDADLVVTGELQGDAAFTLLDGPIDLTVPPHDELAVPVHFAPPTYRAYDARIVLHTNDELHPAVTVPVRGEGVDLPLPDIRIEPGRSVLAPDVEVGSTELMVFDILNVGDDDLHMGQAVLSGQGVFSLSVDPTDTVIAPSQRTTVIVSYAPTSVGGDLGYLELPSDDPDEPTLTVLLIGNGGGPELEPPVAVIDPCPATVQLTGPETVQLSGAGSYDPGGLDPLRYQWEVTRRPDASDADIPLDPDDTRDVDLYVDVAGSWEVSLVVKNTLDVPSEPAVCPFEAIPEDDLHVELSWDTPTADVDLHLMRGGASLFDVPGDCNYCNRNPNWGVAGNDDDPRLDIDDRGGYGPENINILHPANDDYTVAVHYFAHNDDGPVQATVKVWLNGAETWSGTRVLTGTDRWMVGTIAWPAASFTPDPSANIPNGPVGCR